MKQAQLILALILTVFCLSQAFGSDRAPINVNLIIDGSSSLTDVKGEITAWANGRLDQILATGDRVTIWSAAQSARVVYQGTINSQSDRDAAKKSITDLAGSGAEADFQGALREAAGLQSTGFSYTLLISASPEALARTISGPQGNLLRISRIEEFSGWRAFVIGLNMENRVKRAAAAFLGS